MNDFGVLFHQNARIIFSNSTMSKITFVALRRSISPPSRWGSFWVIGYWILVMGNWLLDIGLNCSSAAIPASNLSPLTSNLSTRLSSGEQRLPRQRRQQKATLSMLRQQENPQQEGYLDGRGRSFAC